MTGARLEQILLDDTVQHDVLIEGCAIAVTILYSVYAISHQRTPVRTLYQLRTSGSGHIERKGALLTDVEPLKGMKIPY